MRSSLAVWMVRSAPVVWLSSSVALGSEGAEGGGGSSLFTGDLGNILWSLLTFATVLAVLGKFAWGPILGALKQREDFIRDSLEKAKSDREASEAKLKEYEQKLQDAREEASALVQEGRRDAEAVKVKIQEAAKVEADALLARAKREIGLATDSAVQELYSLGAKLATDVAAQIIRKELDPREHERLIAESIQDLEGVGGNGRSAN